MTHQKLITIIEAKLAELNSCEDFGNFDAREIETLETIKKTVEEGYALEHSHIYLLAKLLEQA